MSVQQEQLAPPAGLEDQMFYSTVSSLDRKPSVSSDEDGDIYRPGGHAPNCPSNQTQGKETQSDQDAQDKELHRPDQVTLTLTHPHTHQADEVSSCCVCSGGRKLDGLLGPRMWDPQPAGD